MKFLNNAVFLLCGTILSTQSLAFNDVTNLELNAFFTGGFSVTDSDIPFIGVQDNANFDDVSRLGMQLTFKPRHDIPVDFTLQILGRGRNNWELEAEWAMMTYTPSPKWNLNLGKIRAPFFMYSQQYDVGVTYPWIIPPEELYGFANMPFTSISGADINHIQNIGQNWTLNSKIFTGQNDFTVPVAGMDIEAQIQRTTGLVFNLTNSWLTLNMSYIDMEYTTQEVDAIINDPGAKEVLIGFANFFSMPTDPVALASLLSMLGIDNTTNGKLEFMEAGFIIDKDFLLIGEYVKRRMTNTNFPTTNNWMLTSGYHFGKYTPLLTIARSDTSGSVFVMEQTAYTLGFNIGTSASSALKFELSKINIDDTFISLASPLGPIPVNNIGLYDNLPTAFGGPEIEDEVHRFSVAFSMVW